MEYLARVNPKYFAAIHQCAAKGDVRYYLNAVQIERHPKGGVLIVATNGHFMGVIHDPDGWIADGRESVLIGTVSKRLLSACSVRTGADGRSPSKLWIAEKFSLVSSLEETGEEPEMFGFNSHLTEKTELIDGLFPNWKRVIPTKRRTEVEPFPCINGEYLEVFNKVGVLLTGIKRFGGAGMRIEPSAGDGGVIVRFNDNELLDRFFGVVMPMASEPLPGLLPDWAAHEAEAAKAAEAKADKAAKAA
ncbi:hypothetical protein [Pseudomonas segetis]|uniref:DNA polymerase-3 subunit beta n=1 Tax=Pseudomonas segetis TaxID=298908 RepID=A0A239C8W9_9PSED|nr:hypothetical protein [Pseudomonas segetis]SNS16696.1 DNA polymerase-3 subunit beta [Pseudomonas segetis]